MRVLPKNIVFLLAVLGCPNPLLADFSPSEVTRELKRKAKINKLRYLEAVIEQNNVSYIEKPAQTIVSIAFSKRSFETQTLEKLFPRHLGKIDDPQMANRIFLELREAAHRAGYLKADITIDRKVAGEKVTYEVHFEPGIFCRIQKINFPFALPEPLKLQIAAGDRCDLDELDQAIEDLELQLQELEFGESFIKFAKITYSENSEAGEIFISGYLGKKIQYEIDDPDMSYVTRRFANPIKEIDTSVLDHNGIRNELLRYYRDKGFQDAVVDGPTSYSTDSETRTNVFSVKRGPRYFISEVVFSGNEFFDTEKLIVESGIYKFADLLTALSTEAIANAVDRIKNLYIKSGFWQIKVPQPIIEKDLLDSTAQVKFEVNEGPQTVLGRVSFVDNNQVSNTELQAFVSVGPGAPIPPSFAKELEEKVRSHYIDLGFIDAKVETESSTKPDGRKLVVDVRLMITEGTKSRIRSIKFTGLVRTAEVVPKRELLFEEGDWYTPKMLARSRDRLLKLGIFSSVQLVIERPTDKEIDDHGIVDITIQLKEGNFGRISFGPGFNLRKGFQYSSEFLYKNLFGFGRQLNIKAGLSQEKSQIALVNRDSNVVPPILGRRFGIGILEPHLFDLPLDGKISGLHHARADHIQKYSTSAELSATYTFRQSNIYRTSYLAVYYGIRRNEDVGSDLQEDSLVATGTSQVGAVGVRYFADSRDDTAWPASGSTFKAEVELARFFFGGDTSYLKYEFTNNHFFRIFRDLVFATGYSFTVYDFVKRENAVNALPSSERLFAGGSDRIRGFAERLGPYVTTSNRDVLGGSRRVQLKNELRVKVYKDVAGMAIFLDSGNVFLSPEEQSALESNFRENDLGFEIADNATYTALELLKNPKLLWTNHYVASGIALKLLSPIGSINFALAWPVSEPEFDCQNRGLCFSRMKNEGFWLNRYKIELSIGSMF